MIACPEPRRANIDRYSAKRRLDPASAGRPDHISLVYQGRRSRRATFRHQGVPAFTSHGLPVTSHFFPRLGSQLSTVNSRTPSAPSPAPQAQKHRSASPLFATLTHSLSRKSFACHSYANTGDGGVTPPKFVSGFDAPLQALNTFRINTCKSVSKQTSLTSFRINTYEKTEGGGTPLRHLRARRLSRSDRGVSPFSLQVHFGTPPLLE